MTPPLVLESFERQAARSPGAVAARLGSETLSYGELEAASAALAAELSRRGIGANCLVPVLVERSLDLPVAVLGVLRAGAAYVPLESRWPEARRREVLAQVGAEVSVVEAALTSLLPPGHPFVEVDRESAAAAAPEIPSPSAEDSAYVIFTSGSTGKPKGIVVDHGALASFLGWARGYFDLGPETRMLQFARLTFDPSIWEIFGTLSSGGTLVLVPPEVAESPPLLNEAMEEFAITHCEIVPSIFGMLDPARAPSLRQCLIGGERVLREVVEQWSAPGRTFVNGYGPAEATVVCVTGRCGPGESGPVPIGVPIAGARAYLLDDELEPVPRGEAGELFLAGATLARGYLGQPRETASRFLPDPFSERPGERMYRTGDLARELEDGRLVFVGRRDRQVKIAGQRVEPDEVEAVLRGLPGVTDSAVVAFEKENRTRLAAFLTGTASAVAATRECRARLPGHLVPSSIEILDELPLGSTGKIDRDALMPRLNGHLSAAEGAPGDGREGAEALVLRAAAEVLGTDPDPRRSFVEMGGDSLDAMRLISRLPIELGRELTVWGILEAPSLEEACAAVGERATAPIRAAQFEPPKPAPAAAGGGRRLDLFHPTARRSRIITAAPEHAWAAAEVLYESFRGLYDRHGFPGTYPSVEFAEQITRRLIEQERIWGAVALSGGRVAGVGFIDERGPVRAISLLGVDPHAQEDGIGRRLTEALVERGAGDDDVRLLQDGFNVSSLALYVSFGFHVREPLVLLSGRPPSKPDPDVEVRALEASDLAECERLHVELHGYERGGELRDSLGDPLCAPLVAVRDGAVVAYTATLAYFPLAHSIARSEEEMKQLILGAGAASSRPLSFLMPTHQSELLRWCLAEGFRTVKPMNLLTLKEYERPAGSWMPSSY